MNKLFAAILFGVLVSASLAAKGDAVNASEILSHGFGRYEGESHVIMDVPNISGEMDLSPIKLPASTRLELFRLLMQQSYPGIDISTGGARFGHYLTIDRMCFLDEMQFLLGRPRFEADSNLGGAMWSPSNRRLFLELFEEARKGNPERLDQTILQFTAVAEQLLPSYSSNGEPRRAANDGPESTMTDQNDSRNRGKDSVWMGVVPVLIFCVGLFFLYYSKQKRS